MIEIGRELGDIQGVSKTTLKNFSDQGIKTVADLQQQTRSPKERELLAPKLGVELKILYFWAKQADLMRIKSIDASASQLIASAGIRNVTELAVADTQILKKRGDAAFNSEGAVYEKNITVAELEAWKGEAYGLVGELINDEDDEPLETLFASAAIRLTSSMPKSVLSAMELKLRDNAKTILVREELKQVKTLDRAIHLADLASPKAVEGGFFFSMSDLIAEIARGVSKAQLELDKTSLAIQNQIEADETLRNYGLSATWYAMPETSFTLKVDYAVIDEKTKEGTHNLPGNLRVAPVNATYQNYFKSTSTVDSTLNFKIVPVPPPVMYTEPITVPDLIDLSLEEAKERIRDARLCVGVLELIKGVPDNGKDTQVIAQSKDAGTEIRINDFISVAYYKKEG